MATYEQMLRLQHDWDSYGAGPIDPRATAAAQAFEAALCRVPICTGGVQLEWHIHGVTMEIEFAPDGSVVGIFAKDERTPDGNHVELELGTAVA